MQTFRKLPTTVPIANSPHPRIRWTGQRSRPRGRLRRSGPHERGQRSRIGVGHLRRGRPAGVDDGVGHRAIERRPRFEDPAISSRVPGGGQGGAVGQPAGVGPEPAGQHLGVGRQPDDEAERPDQARGSPRGGRPRPRSPGSSRAGVRQVAEDPLLPVAEGGLALLGEDRGGSAGRRAPRARRSASANGRPSRSARIRPTVDLPVPR